MHRIASIIVTGAVASVLLVAGLGQEWFQRRCAENGLPVAAVVLAVAIVAAGAGVLAAQLGVGQRPSVRFRMTACESCGQSLMESWKMCPYCGHIAGEPSGRRGMRSGHEQHP